MLFSAELDNGSDARVARSVSLFKSKYDSNKEFLKIVGGCNYSQFASRVNSALADAIADARFDPASPGNIAERSLMWNNVVRKFVRRLEDDLTT